MKHIHVHVIITQKHLSAHKWKENIHRNLFASRCNLQDYINSVEANNRSINKPTHFIINSTLRGRINLKKGSWGDEGIKKGACFLSRERGGVEHDKTIYKDCFLFEEKQRTGVNTNVKH